jgi:glycosyltransferase involved in cell wall biosynthesis
MNHSIVHVLAPAEFGGLERVVCSLAAGQVRTGHEVNVAAVLDAGRDNHPFVASLQRAGVAVTGVSLSPRSYWKERSVLGDLYHRLRPSVVHSHGYRADVVDGPIARKLGIPTVSTVHGFTGGGWKNRLYERLQRRVLRGSDAVVAVSRSVHEMMREDVPPHRLHFIANAWSGADECLERAAARHALGVDGGEFHIGWVGRLSREKGPDLFLEALTLLRDLTITASVVGDGRERTHLVARTARCGLADRVRWHGTIPDAARLHRAFDIFVLSSRSEGTPMVLFEAMAAGTPIVATRTGGVPDVLTVHEALLVPPEDPAALADAIRSVYCDPAGAARRGAAARARLENSFALTPWLDRYDEVYEQVARDDRGATV